MNNPTKIAINIASIVELKNIELNNRSQIKEEISRASETGLINSLIDSNLALVPKLILVLLLLGGSPLSFSLISLISCFNLSHSRIFSI